MNRELLVNRKGAQTTLAYINFNTPFIMPLLISF